MYQAMSLIVACFSEFWDMLDSSLAKIANIFQEVIPSDITPISNSVLMQILVTALYSSLIMIPEKLTLKKEVTFHLDKEGKQSNLEGPMSGRAFDSAGSVKSAALAAAEHLCSIDEDNKHTDQIGEFLSQVDEAKDDLSIFINAGSAKVDDNQKIIEIIVSDLLMTIEGKKGLKTLFHFLKHNSEWVYWKLGISEKEKPASANRVLCPSEPLVHKMFHIGYRPFDQLLTKQLKPNWHHLLQASLGLTLEKVWNQVSRRWEFQSSASSQLTTGDVDIVNNLTLILKQ